MPLICSPNINNNNNNNNNNINCIDLNGKKDLKNYSLQNYNKTLIEKVKAKRAKDYDIEEIKPRKSL